MTPIYPHLARSESGALLGRDALLTSVAAQLASTRLLTLNGPGGVGKTCLARQLIHARNAHWVDLAPLAEAAFVPQAIAAACGLPEQHGQPWLETLIDGLRETEALLVLDTCEHLRAGCADLCAALLDACPRLTILATSRVPLTTPGEICCAVPPLDEASAVGLFAAHASAHLPGFSLSAATQPLVAQICARLDGMPLAIELAAARATLLTIAQIAERLAHSLDLLAARDPALPARQRSLRATLDWSYALLADAEQALFRRLSVFAGSFDLDAVEAVCGLPHALDQLAALLDTSLVTIAARDETSVARYRLHDVVRQYAAERLAAAGETEMFHARQLAWAVALVEQIEPELFGANQAAWLARLRLDRENIRAALQAAEHMRDADSMLRLAGALRQFWNTESPSEGRSWLQRALRLAADRDSLPLIKAWNTESFLAYRQGDYEGMQRAADMALRQAMHLEHAEGIADAYYHLGIYGEMMGDVNQSREHYQQGLALYQQLQERRGIINTLNGLAHIANLEGKVAEARGYYEQGLALARAADDRRTTMLLLISLGNLLLDSPDPSSAEPFFAESMIHLRALGEASYLPYVANGLGEVARNRGDLGTAAAHYDEGLRQSHALKLDDMAGQLLLKLGDVAAEAGDYPSAARDLSAGTQIYARTGRTRRIVISVHLCAKYIQRLGYSEQAVTLFAAGLRALAANDFEYLGKPDGPACAAALAAARAALIPADYQAALAAGQALTLAQAVQLALSAIHLPPRAAGARPPELQIFTLGALRVLRHGRELTAEDWVYGKTRELMLYLLYVDSATKERIGAALWPEASERQLKHNFRTAIYHLRRALGDAEWITFQAGRYAFNRARDYWLDGEAFIDALAQAEREPARRAEHLQRAAELYRGDLALESLESETLLLRHEQLRQQAIDALIGLGALRLEDGMLPAAADAYRRAIALDSYLEAAHRGLLRSLARQGERGAALAHYQALAALLGRDLGVEPAPATRALAEAIAGGQLL